MFGSMPSQVLETSGLIYFKGKLITHNDSGKLPQLYEVDTLTLEVTRTVSVSNASNVDWEDMAQDNDYIYIGDFGNYTGTREDLTVYRISKSEYEASDRVVAERIDFSYEDQNDFSETLNSIWDAEAMIALDNHLVIFTRQWENNQTIAYSIPKQIGNVVAKNLGTYDVNGVVTGATFNELSKIVYLLGYSQQLQPFVVRIENFSETTGFTGNEQKTMLNVGFAQTEGITHVGVNRYFVSSEEFVNSDPPITLQSSLFSFETDDRVEEETPEVGNPDDEDELVLFRALGSKLLEYQLNLDTPLFGRAIFDASGRRVRYTNGNLIENNSIDLSAFQSSVYYITFYLRGRTISKPFILD